MEVTEIQMVKLVLQALLVLGVGLVLWRVMAMFSKKKAKTKGSSYFQTKYSDKWKNR